MDILSVVTQEVQEIFSQVAKDTSVSLETLEASVHQACRELGRKVLETCFSKRAAESDSASVACAACGGEARRLRQRKCYIETLCGVLRVSRWVYRCACGLLWCLGRCRKVSRLERTPWELPRRCVD